MIQDIDRFWPMVRGTRVRAYAPTRVIPEEILYLGLFYKKQELAKCRMPVKYSPHSNQIKIMIPPEWPWVPGAGIISSGGLYLTPTATMPLVNIHLSILTRVYEGVTFHLTIENNFQTNVREMIIVLMRMRNSLPVDSNFI